MLYIRHFNETCSNICRRTDQSLSQNRSAIEIGYNNVPNGFKQIFKRDVFIIHYVTTGKGKFMGKDFSAGDCYYVSEGEFELIEADTEEPYENYWIVAKGQNAKEILSNCGLPKHNSIFRFDHVNECAEIIKHYLFDEAYKNELMESCKLEEVFYKLLSYHINQLEIQNVKKDFDTKVTEIANYIDNNFPNIKKISDLCQVFYFSPNHLCYMFNHKFGISPKEYLIERRISKAKELLNDSYCNLSISEISKAIGIDNPLYFSRLFSQREGIPPTEYRKKIKSLKMIN